jgi:hypothetical protein
MTAISVLTAGLLGFIAGGSAMTALQKAMAKQYAYAIHDKRRTLDDVKPQTAEYRAYVAAVYKEMFHEDL